MFPFFTSTKVPMRKRKMENMVLKVTLYRHNGVFLPSVCCIFFYHLWHDCGYKCLLSLKTGMDVRVLRRTGVERDRFVSLCSFLV